MSEILNKQGTTEAEVKEYLDKLRDSGDTNMLGAGIYLQTEFLFTKDEARAELMRWLKNF